MGKTILTGDWKPIDVKKEIDKHVNNSLDDELYVNNIKVGPRKARRERRKAQAQQQPPIYDKIPQKTSAMIKQAPKQKSLANNSETIMNKKQAALVKLAQTRLAINYVLRNRYMSKQAAPLPGSPDMAQWQQANPAMNPSMNMNPGMGMNPGMMSNQQSRPVSVGGYTIDPSMSMPLSGMPNTSLPSMSTKAPVFSTGNPVKPRSAKELMEIGNKQFGINSHKFNKATGTWTYDGGNPAERLEALKAHRRQLRDWWQSLTPEERHKYYSKAKILSDNQREQQRMYQQQMEDPDGWRERNLQVANRNVPTPESQAYRFRQATSHIPKPQPEVSTGFDWEASKADMMGTPNYDAYMANTVPLTGPQGPDEALPIEQPEYGTRYMRPGAPSVGLRL